MATLYTSKIITPSLSSFHDIAGIASLSAWADQSVPDPTVLENQRGPEYPYYSKTPLPVFNNFQYGFAPNARFSFFAYGTEFLNTTAYYDIYDEFAIGGKTQKRKYIPPLNTEALPASAVPIFTIPNASFFAADWYVTINRIPLLDESQIKSASYLIKTVIIDGIKHETRVNLDVGNDIPEMKIETSYDPTSEDLTVSLDTIGTLQQQVTYNGVVNGITLPITDNILTTSHFACSISNSDVVYQIPPALPGLSGGTIYTFVHDNTHGGLIETKYVQNSNEIVQKSTSTVHPGTVTGIDVVITNANEVSCIVPTGTWYVSGVYIDLVDQVSPSNLQVVGEENFSTVTFLDTISAYDRNNSNTGAVAAKYNLRIESGNYLENRTIYLDWFRSAVNQVEYITTNSLASSDLFALSAVPRSTAYNAPIDIYGAPVNNTNNWIVTGCKTEINFDNLGVDFIASNDDIDTSAWTGLLSATGFDVGDVITIDVDSVNAYEDGVYTNMGGAWDILLVQPGGQLIVKKDITAIWSSPENNQISYEQNTYVVLDTNNQYPSVSGTFNLYALYDTEGDNAPVTISVRTTIPLEVYGCRQIFSRPEKHLDNVTHVVPFTGFTSDIFTDSETNSKQGAKYTFMVLESSILAVEGNAAIGAIYTHEQLSTNTAITGFTVQDVALNFDSTTVDISSSKSSTNVFNLSSNGVQYYIAGYKTYSNSASLPHVSNLTRTISLSTFTLDSIDINTAYDLTWYVKLNSRYSPGSKIQKVQTVFNNTGAIETLSEYLTATNTNSDILSTMNCYTDVQDTTLTLYVSCAQEDIASLSAVDAYIYKTNTAANYCIYEDMGAVLPSVPEAEIDYVFTYPGTYSVRVSAVTGSDTVTSVLTNFDFYFKILDIPPLVNFDITSEFPAVSDYTAYQGATSTELSYYKSNTTFDTISTYGVYVNTWSTAPGAFGIESIWIDYGDGSSVEKIYKSRDISDNPDELAFDKVQDDPRNHVFYHTYVIPDYNEYSYNVSVTAFSQNTNAYSTGYKTISSFVPVPPVKKYLLANTLLNDDSIIYNVQVDNSKSGLLHKAANVSSIQYSDSRYYSIST